MKSLILALVLAVTSVNLAAAEPETKRVCIDKTKDGKPILDKSGKPQQECKEVKQHKKLEGTKVPEKK